MFKRGTLFVAAAVAVAGTACAFASCAPKRDTSIGATRSKLVAPYDAATGLTPPAKQEPSGAFGSPTNFVIGFNTRSPAEQGWALSTDNGATFALQCDFLGVNLIDGGTCPVVPSPVAGGVWAGDPIVVADGLGNIVYVSMM